MDGFKSLTKCIIMFVTSYGIPFWFLGCKQNFETVFDSQKQITNSVAPTINDKCKTNNIFAELAFHMEIESAIRNLFRE